MQARGVAGVADVHPRPRAYRLEALQDLDVLCRIGVRHRRRLEIARRHYLLLEVRALALLVVWVLQAAPLLESWTGWKAPGSGRLIPDRDIRGRGPRTLEL